MRKSLHLAIGLLLVTACRTVKDYRRPALQTPTTFRTSGIIATDTTSIAAMRWEDFFTDKMLRQIIDSVLKRNYDMATAFDNIRLNAAYLQQAKVAWLPEIRSGISAGNNIFSKNSLNGINGFNLEQLVGVDHISDYSINIGISWEADIWGKIKNQKEAALAGWLQSQEARKALQTRLIAEAATGYYNLVMLRKQLDITRRNIALNDSIVQILRIQSDNGDATSLGVQQAEIQRKNTEALIPALLQAVVIQENALRILMAQHPDTLAVPAITAAFAVPAIVKAGIPAHLVSVRPDVREREFALRSANARIGIAQANLYPTFSISAAVGLNTFQAGNWLSFPGSLFKNVAGNALQPVFNKRQLKTQLKISEIQYDQSLTNFKSIVLKAIGEVSDALVSLEKLSERIHINQSQLSMLHKAIGDAELLYANGMANYLEIIFIQQQLLQTELNQADLQRQEVSAYVELYRALGGGVI